MPEHVVSAACRGETCTMCREPATHKVGEEILFDDPAEKVTSHNLTAYVCCRCFRAIMKVICPGTERPDKTIIEIG